jgi:hypothetical protein
VDYDNYAMLCGANDGGIKRGDRADTGDLQARPRKDVGRGGSGVEGGDGGATGHPTGATDSLAESAGGVTISSSDAVGGDNTLDDLRVTDEDDPSLGLTGTPSHPAEDWAADTGPTRTGEGGQEEIETTPLEPPRSQPAAKKTVKARPKTRHDR